MKMGKFSKAENTIEPPITHKRKLGKWFLPTFTPYYPIFTQFLPNLPILPFTQGGMGVVFSVYYGLREYSPRIPGVLLDA